MHDQSKGVILMLDHEPLLIDRRIVLEAQSLIRDGWTVHLATHGDGIKPAITNERGMTVHRFLNVEEEYQLLNLNEQFLLKSKNRLFRMSLDRQKIQGWIENHYNAVLHRKINDFNLPVFLKKVMYLSSWPPAFASALRHRLPRLKKMLGHYFEPLIFLLLIRPSFLLPYIRFAVDRFLHPKSQPMNGNLILSEDSWQKKVYDFAINLKPQFIHVHDLPNLALGYSIAKKINAKLIYDAHELYPLQYFSDEARRTALIKAEREYIGYAEAVITVNSQCVEVLQKEYGVSNIIDLTNATESPEGFDPTLKKNLWHEHFKLTQDTQIMVFQGGINPVRNIDPLVESLVNIRDNIHLGFITYAKDIPYYEEMTKRLGIHHRVHYVVEIPWDQVNNWLASADVGVMPYQVTNFNAKISSPNKLYEFVVAGLPIIASSELDNVKAAIERDHIGVLCLLRGVDTYENAIREMFDHPDGPERFRTNVLAARHKYMWSNEEPKLLSLYDGMRKGISTARSSSANASASSGTRGAECVE